MTVEMSSAERVKLAFAREEPDRVPILFRGIDPWEKHWSGQIERARFLLQRGADARLHLPAPTAMHPEVTTELRHQEARPYPLLRKAYHTPAGDLSVAVQVTPDWRPQDIPLYSDHAWSRGVEYIVKSVDDLAALRYLLHDPRDGDLTDFRERAAQLRREADELGVLLQGNMIPAPLYATGFLGGDRSLLLVRDEPDLLRATLEVVREWTSACLEVLLSARIDCVYRSNCYETIDLFAPSDVREFFLPLLSADADMIHDAGALLHGFAQTGIMPLLDDWVDAGVDIISSLDTVGPNAMDLSECRSRIGESVCLMGGVDNRTPFTDGTREGMERHVIDVLRVLAPGGGYILSPAGMVFPEGRPENIQAFIDAGRRWGRYPLSLP